MDGLNDTDYLCHQASVQRRVGCCDVLWRRRRGMGKINLQPESCGSRATHFDRRLRGDERIVRITGSFYGLYSSIRG